MRTVMLALLLAGALSGLAGCKSTRPHEYGLANTTWTLLDLGTEPVGDVEVYIVFRAGGLVTGMAGCNRFEGTYEMDSDEISFGPLATTQMACEERLMKWEAAVLDALANAEHWELMGNELWISVDGRPAPLRLVPGRH